MRLSLLTIPVLALLLSALLLSGPASARHQTGASREPLLDLNFAGGSAADYIKALRSVAGEANIVVLADLSKVPMPPVQLQNVDVGSSLRLLESLPRRSREGAVELIVREDRSEVGDQTVSVFTVAGNIVPAATADHQDSLVVQVADLLDDQIAADDLLTAVQTALDMHGEEFSPAQIKFHPATGMLIARGHPQQMSLIVQVVDQLSDRRALQGPSKERVQEVERAAAQFQDKARLAQQAAEDFKARCASLEREIDWLQQQLNARDEEIRALQHALAASQRAEPKEPAGTP